MESVDENTRNYRIDRKIFNKIKLGSAVTNWSNIGLSCYSSVSIKIANIELASIGLEEANKICSFDLRFDSEDKHVDLRAIQKGLKRRSLYMGAVDGVLGKGSCAAFNKFMACERTSPASFSREDYLSLLSKIISEEKQSCYDGKSTTTIAAKAISKNGLESQPESLQNTIDGLRSENKNLKQKLVEKKKAESTSQENLRRELEDLRSEYESLKSNILNENKEQTFEAKKTIDELKAQIVELKEKAKKPKEDEQNLVYMATAIANLQKEIAEKEMRSSEQDKKIKKLDAEIEKIEKEKAALKVAIQSLESLLVTKDEVLADKDELYSELERRFQSSKNDIKNIENQYTIRLATKSEEIDRLNNILRSVQQLVKNTSQINKTEDLAKNTPSKNNPEDLVSENQKSNIVKNGKQESSLFPRNPIEGAPFCQGFLFFIADDKYFAVDKKYSNYLKAQAMRHLGDIGKLGKEVISKEKGGAMMVRGMQKAKEFTDIGIDDNNIAKGKPFRSIIDHCVALDSIKEYNSKSFVTEAENTTTKDKSSKILTEVIFEKKWGCKNNAYTLFDKKYGNVFVLDGKKLLGDAARKVVINRKSPTKVELQTTYTSNKFMRNMNKGKDFPTMRVLEEITVVNSDKISVSTVRDSINLDAFMANPKNKKYERTTESSMKVACD